MAIPPEERRRIYEEEKAKIEAARNSRQEEQTLTDLRPGVAGCLCYLGGWITGIVFLILEQKSRFIRFHAVQSIVVFGLLNIGYLLLHRIPFVGPFFGAAVGIVAFVLWIVLLVRAGQGELFMLPGAGELAQKLLGAMPDGAAGGIVAPKTETAPVHAAEAVAEARPKAHASSGAGRAGRIAASAFAIAWSVALLVFLNFFQDYVAYYHLEQVRGHATWFREPFLTADFATWLPIVNVVLSFTIAGHVVLLAIDKYIVRETVLLALDLFGIMSTAALLTIFPFDFGVFGDVLAGPLDFAVHITLAFVIFGSAIGALVRLIKIVVNLIRGTASYG